MIINENKFKNLCEEYCIECEINKKIDKLKILFKIDGKNETDIFKKHNISIRDLNLYVYLNIIQFIKESTI